MVELGKLIHRSKALSPIITQDGKRMLSMKDYQEMKRAQRQEVIRPIFPKPSDMDAKDAIQLHPMKRAINEGADYIMRGGPGSGPNGVMNVSDMEIPPIQESANDSTVALSLWDYERDLLAKARLPRGTRKLYSIALVVGEAWGLKSYLDFVHTDLVLTISEEGKARAEILKPIEHMLMRRQMRDQNMGGRPDIV